MTGQHEEVWDVVVAGGGMAGITAAVAAARTGAKTLLIEQAGWLGGIGITGATGLHSFFNIFGAHAGVGRKRVVAGIAQELVDRCRMLGGALGHVPMEKGADFVSMLTPVDPEVFRWVAVDTCLQAGVRLLFPTVAEDVRAEAGHVEALVVWNKAGRRVIRARQFVDCTGDGIIAAAAGAPTIRFKPGDPGAYSAGFTFRLCNVDLGAMEADLERRGMITQLAHAVKPGMSQPDLVRLAINMRPLREAGVDKAPGGFLSSSVRPREITYCNCINYGPNDGLDVEALSDAEIVLRGKMFDVVEVFRKHIAGCENCYPAGATPSVGQRRALAIRCDYELTAEDCIQARQFDDQIGCFAFIDNPRDFVQNGGAYGIPYRALIPQGLDNLLIAGRMMTVELSAHNSTRNTVCCMVCGQAAGTAAAMAADDGKGSREVDAGALRARLAQDGALLEPRDDPMLA
ncbi:MAG: FAD-dependent oxidoreductase [Chloroflexi bacterium]|nr:FAD-dependent oxidoreductase [Chloroflexota bacterium]